ncbi:MAG: LysM peptidoglycan-binding domain-containing protein [Candidatus Paraimprobicoccus trichonymphae]|uniref:LysM peptidoglycan-binding domain-containing protein n=1 Tax=Candidatus Paraimprobicoccus trichonymphae TaxID=3033793 RepID=A0AA48IBZ1_9FIRM|nr:MAG: LysM peptidoglycan-binding domain-containing protein [Candidatus Paraimprobicoccus trichonymphae]
MENSDFYTVLKGDTLCNIAKKFLGDTDRFQEIMMLNNLEDENVYPGQTLRLPKNQCSGDILYKVKSGDSLWDIAQRFLGNGKKFKQIIKLNKLTTDMLYPGQILKIPTEIPSNTIYTVKKGDTLWKISQNFFGDGSKYADLLALNNLPNDKIKVGQKLKIN